MAFEFVKTDSFTPNTQVNWIPFGNVTNVSRKGSAFTLTSQSGPALQLTFLSDTCFRVRFNPSSNDFTTETSVAVVNRDLGTPAVNVTQQTASVLEITTAAIRVVAGLQPFLVNVFRGNQLISADTPGQGIVYIPGQTVIANFKNAPQGALYCGFGEKAGAHVLKNQRTMTQFNFDNFKYVSAPVTSPGGGPLDDREALYISIPVLIENNPAPAGGAPYAYGIFFDNPSQSYFNITTNDYSDMSGKYYFGALYGDLDYYFLFGSNGAPDVLAQYTTLTGRGPMPPKYVFGYHQGGYGYYDRYKLGVVASSYRAARIPCDGLHIDVDFQNNYRTFTTSEMKFPGVAEMMSDLHSIGFKCSTNITPLMTDNTLDENGNVTPYTQLDDMHAVDGLLYNTRAGGGEDPNLFVGQVSYGTNFGTNPYPYPPLPKNSDGFTPLTAFGYYPDFGRDDVRARWGEQYKHLVQEVGLDMVWQDMMCPALANTTFKTFPLDLMMNDGADYQPNAVIHNQYALNLLRATWEGLGKLRPERRNFIIARGGYAGMQRYAAAWTGDSASDWAFLQINPVQVINLGLSGVPISGTDIGGFATGPIPSGTTTQGGPAFGSISGGITNYELLTRWIHLGSFLPWFRNHYDGYNKQFQEVYQYGEPVPTNCRTYIELRYRMLQVYYDAMYEWTQSGMPIVRPLFLNDPADPNVWNHLDDQFFVGRDFLVAPMLTQCITANPPVPPVRSVYLPAGSQWYAFKDNKAALDAPVDGGTLIPNWYADLSLVPIYVRAGAILPFRNLEQWVGQLAANPLTINIYPGPDSSHVLYLDDGISTEAQSEDKYRLTEVTHTGINGGQNIRVQRLFDQYTPPEPFYFIALPGTRHPSSVAVGGTDLTDVGGPDALASSPVNAYYWNGSIQVTFIKVFDTQPDVTVTALYF